MMTRLFLLILTIALTIAFVPAMTLRAQQGEPVAGKHVIVDLLSDAASVQPGQSFTVGVRLKMDPHWHTYWLNPGDSGQPPSVKWTLPEGFTAGELQFPVPVKLTQPGDIVGYGYEDEVVLLTTIKSPQELPTGTPVDIKANVSWLVCDDVCIPGKAALSMSLPVGVTIAPSAHVKLIDEWRQRLPVGQSKAKELHSIGWGAYDDESYHVGVLWKSAVKDVEFFPPPSATLSFTKTTLTTENEGAFSKFRVYASPLANADADFRGLNAIVVYTADDGERRGIVVPLEFLQQYVKSK